MYNVKGPSKIVAKTRRGLTQNIDNFREHGKNYKGPESRDSSNGPKPVFQSTNRKQNFRNNNNYSENSLMTPQHEEIIKYINDSWNFICSELDSGNDSINNNVGAIYYEDDPVTALDNFKPFDLESWWGKRLYTYITNSISNKN